MKLSKFLKVGIALASLPLLSSQVANAATDTANLTVQADVIASCTVDPAVLDFGNYDPTSATDATQASSIDVTCTNGTSYDISLSAGDSGDINNRSMDNILNYNLYLDAGHVNIWGDTIPTNTAPGTGTGSVVSTPVYGKIPKNQAVATGAYNDTITITVTY